VESSRACRSERSKRKALERRRLQKVHEMREGQSAAAMITATRPRSPSDEQAAAGLPAAPPVRKSERLPCPKKRSPFEGFVPFDPPDLHDWPTEAKLAIGQKLLHNPDAELDAGSRAALGTGDRQRHAPSGPPVHHMPRRGELHTIESSSSARSGASDANTINTALQQRRIPAAGGKSIKKGTLGAVRASRREPGAASSQIRTRRSALQSGLTADTRARGSRLLGFVSHVFQSIF
jgi:hypothetical protein